jgi:hypothetical protein
MKRSLFTSTVAALIPFALCSAQLVACQTQPGRHLGDSLDERSLDLQPPGPMERLDASPLDFVGRWQGEAEEPLAIEGVRETYTFPSGSTRFLLEIETPGELTPGSLRGTLVFGSGSTPPLDPERGFPSDVDYSDLSLTGFNYEGPLPPYEGYAYTVKEFYARSAVVLDDQRNALIADGVLPLLLNTAELITPWCRLQRPLPTGSGMSCVKGNSGSSSASSGECSVSFSNLTPAQEAEVVALGVSLLPEQVDCNKIFLCRTLCECTETKCDFNAYVEGARSLGELRVRRVGDTLIGLFSQSVFMNERQLPVPLGTVRFTRVAE